MTSCQVPISVDTVVRGQSIVDSSVHIHTSAELAPWFGEVVLQVTHLKKQGVLTNLCERVRFARRRFGRYEVIDFLAVLFGYAISGERTYGGSSTRASSPSLSRSWRYLTVTDSRPAQRSRVFWWR